MKIYIVATNMLGVHEFEMDTDVDPDLPYAEFVKAVGIPAILDKNYPGWVNFDINIDEADIIIPNMFGKIELPQPEEE
jgi:hypothetical protein